MGSHPNRMESHHVRIDDFTCQAMQRGRVAVGWGGVFGLSLRARDREAPGTGYTFAVDSKAEMPKFVDYQMSNLISGVKYNPADVTAGTVLYVSNCVACHGVPGVDRGGNIRNLAYVDSGLINDLRQVVFKGPYADHLEVGDGRRLRPSPDGTHAAIPHPETGGGVATRLDAAAKLAWIAA